MLPWSGITTLNVAIVSSLVPRDLLANQTQHVPDRNQAYHESDILSFRYFYLLRDIYHFYFLIDFLYQYLQ